MIFEWSQGILWPWVLEWYLNGTLCVYILSKGLLQVEAVEHFAGDNDHGNHEF